MAKKTKKKKAAVKAKTSKKRTAKNGVFSDGCDKPATRTARKK